MNDMREDQTSWLAELYNPAKHPTLIDEAMIALRNAPDFSAIAVRGMSGAIFGTLLAHALGKPLALVRKISDSTHASRFGPAMMADGNWTAPTYLFVDDFIITGNTFRDVQRALPGKPVGIYLYRDVGRYRKGFTPLAEISPTDLLQANYPLSPCTPTPAGNYSECDGPEHDEHEGDSASKGLMWTDFTLPPAYLPGTMPDQQREGGD